MIGEWWGAKIIVKHYFKLLSENVRLETLENAVRRCSIKNCSQSFSRKLQKSTCARVSFLIKLLVEAFFPVNFFFFFFSIRVFFHGHWQLTGQQGKGGDLFLFHSTTSTRSRTFRHLCATFARGMLVCAMLVFTRLLLDKIYHLILWILRNL